MSQRKLEQEKERLLRIISLCMAVESKQLNPFEVEVEQILEFLRQCFPKWKTLDEIVLDAQTLNQIATIVKLQGDWVKYRSTSLYVDPLLIEFKIKMIPPSKLAALLEEAWHPIIEMEGLSRRRIQEAVDYWNNLASLDARRVRFQTMPETVRTATEEELLKRKLLSETTFGEVLKKLWLELKARAASEGKISYWKFIRADTYEETVRRAYLTSFLITYGYASLQVNPLKEEIFLAPNEKVAETTYMKQAISVPIAISKETWRNMER